MVTCPDPWTRCGVPAQTVVGLRSMIATSDALRLGLITAAVLAVLGLGIAWLPLTAHRGGLPILPRLVMAAGVLSVVFFGFDIGAMLGAGAAVLGGLASWDTRPPADAPRPQRVAIIVVATATGCAVAVALAGWVPLAGTEVLRLVAAVALGAVGTLATLAVADRERSRLRDLATSAGRAIRLE